jgi:hypothetical protein
MQKMSSSNNQRIMMTHVGRVEWTERVESLSLIIAQTLSRTDF